MENSSYQPLTDSELNRLAEFLDSFGEPAMNIETLDGFFSAMICGPHLVRPSEYFPTMWRREVAFESDAQKDDIMSLLMRHWNMISSELEGALNGRNARLPLLQKRADGVAAANDWAHGFMHAAQMRPDGWSDLIADEENSGAILPIMMLHHEHDVDPEMRPPKITPEKRKRVLEKMSAGLTHIYQYFESRRQGSAKLSKGSSILGEMHKIGRNERCPCGSGRKHKHCCLGTSPTLH